MTQLLIGGQALAQLGSSRHTSDTDYLVFDESSKKAFIHDAANNVDYCNANGNKFFAAVFLMENSNQTGRASVKALIELKAYSFVQHCLNRNFKKADEAEFDIKFLTRLLGAWYPCPIAKKHMATNEYNEVIKVIRSVKF